MSLKSTYRKQVLAEVEALPPEFLPFLLQMIRAYRDSISLKPAAASFRRGWEEAQAGQTFPLEQLWDEIDGD